MIMTNKQEKFIREDYEKKIDELIAKMTLKEKIGQLVQISPSLFGAFGLTVDELIQKLVNGELSPEEFEKLDRDYHEDEIREGIIGSMGGVIGAEKSNELQRIAIEESRLGIPMLFGLDVIHGFRTVFPIPLAEACSFDIDMIKKSARIAAKEASAAGIHWTFAPMVDISRDPRWGRIAEGAGEDTYLGSVIAAARVEGFQGDDLSDTESILACAKHFAAYGAAVAGRDYNTVDMSLQTLHEVYLPPFEAAAKAGAATFMSSFNDINGVPSTANKYLLTDVLRGKFGFNGFVVSDANSVAECVVHGHSADRKEASRKALLAGLDMDMSHGTFREDLPDQAADGTIPEEVLNEAVRRILRIKFMMGLFDNPYRTSKEKEEKTILCAEHIEAAREMAKRSIVLLKNENNILPLKKNLKKIAVVGPLADNAEEMLGTWAVTGRAEDVVTILSGIKSKVSSETEILYAKGCEITGDKDADFKEAVEAASKADVVIAVVGEKSDMSGEASSRMYLDLPGKQEELLKALHETNKPLIVVLINGRPLTIPWVSENAASIVEAWQLGIQSGPAVADVLFGDYNPSGKLVVTFPYSVGQVPIYYNHPMTGRPAGKIKFTSKYIDGPVEPLYPFGFGLSYTTFSYNNLVLSSTEVKANEKLIISVDVTNTGNVAGEEIVQVYVSDVTASRVRPVKELKGFKKILLQPGQCETVSIELNVSELGFYNENLEYIVEPGLFKIYAGPNSKEGLEGEFNVYE
ncbi:glycoside hydrolase family 3 C-terminal domain-containing protein [Clostridium sp. SYSU_GA19001]|uniref:glycoside hydrolase family 3 N-terminal domain-containing protein n=1 Tax=Clostridium caldaquaticum TaxID=2940653 RepID=UPI002076D893|nr:glycoside hydrolase family 3 N-terminal domain-containing protein [Clostridium caldaquaticum]MCM8709902.1 glycoside hydrolase family 3 C-terminal domain-containing protein [Clostridium caldaquaticum]